MYVELTLEHGSEQRALWNLICLIEEKLTEPCLKKIIEIPISARERLVENPD